MAAETQQYPPWLTPIPSVIDDANGVPITTSTTVSLLPLTYYGPSIPLNPDWTYGGITSPVSTSSTTAIPTTSLSSSINTAVSSSISTTTTPASISSFASSPISSVSVTLTPTQSSRVGDSGLTRGQLVGVIVASILGFIFLLVLIFAVYLFCKGKRRRRSRDVGAPIDDDYYVVSGSPRHSGEEADPFLVRHRGRNGGSTHIMEKTVGSGTSTQYTEIGARPPSKIVPRVPPPLPTTAASLGSSNSSSTNSGYGEPLAHPTLGIRPIREEYEQEMSEDAVPSSEELQRLDQENVPPLTEEQEESGERYSGAYAYRAEIPPPKLVDPALKSSVDFTLPRPPFAKRPSLSSHRSSLPLDVDENATLLTARRVKIGDLGPRPSPGSFPVEVRTGKPSTSSFLGSLSAIGRRLSWRRNESLHTSQHQPLLQSSPLSDQDLEQARLPPPVFTPPQMSEPILSRGSVSVGLNPDGARPISNVSGRSQNSGGSLYHDALSSLPGTPSDATSAMSPPLSTTRPTMPSQLSQPQMPSHDNQYLASQAGLPCGNYAQALDLGCDVLDMPAPSAIFNVGSNPSLQTSTSDATVVDYTTGKSSHSSTSLYLSPPGLDAISHPKQSKLRSELSKDTASSPGIDQNVGTDITIDVLEEEPPTAGEGWRSMAAATSTNGDDDVERLARRTTFGMPMYVAGIDFMSEQGSLHSMRSHIGPSSPLRSTGSAAASARRELLYGSNSSHPSGFSAARSTGTNGSAALSFTQSLVRSGSITSDGRRRGHISPALSAFGNRIQDNANDPVLSRAGSSSGSGSRPERVMLQSPNTAYLGPEKGASTISSAMSG